MPEVAEQVAETVAETRKAPEPEAETPRETVDAGAEDDGKKPRRRGWWSIGR